MTNAKQTGGTSCACSTVDLESGSVTLAVIADGAGSTSVSQRVSQVNGDARVRIDVKYDGTDVEIAGETAANGNLVVNVTRDGEVVNESVEIDAEETDVVAFRLESDGVRISTEKGTECPCETVDDIDVDVPGAEDTNVNVGNVEVNVPGLDRGDSEAHAHQEIDDSDENFQSQRNAAEGDANATKGTECGESPSGDEQPSADISPNDRPASTSGTASNVFRAVVRPNDLAGLAKGDAGREISVGGILSALGHETEGESD